MAPPRGQAHWIGARPTRGVTLLLVAEIAAFLVYIFLNAPDWVAQHLALTPERAFGPEPWQIATSAFIHLHAMKLFSSAIGIWVFGTAVEQQTSQGRLLGMFAASQLAGTLVLSAIGRLFVPQLVFDGCSPAVFGFIAAFGVIYGPVPLRFFGAVEMRGRTMALLVLGLSFLTGLLNGQWIALAGDATGMVVGYQMASGGDRKLGQLLDRLKLWRLRRRYRVIQGGRDSKRFLN